MNKKIKAILLVAILVILLVIAYFAYNILSKNYKEKMTPQTQSSQQSNSAESQDSEKIPAPDFVVTDKDGNQIKLSDYFGKPIVINFWASWCPPCKAELPDFEKIYKDKKDDIVFLMIDMVDGQRETVEKAYDFITKNKYTFPVYYDAEQEASYTYQISSLPTTLFIDKDGNIVSGHQGQIDKTTLLDNISKIEK